ncbi:MAG TPA: type II toxin-antitoxin system VapC family toxin [Nitrospirae bacterium]|nr:type II toxin-antitoxin system VapC family toxin [Nitrospirota bacterium]
MNLVDSCGWLEYFADGPNADFFAKPLCNIMELIVPTICIHEVFKSVLRQKGEEIALQILAIMEQAHVIELDTQIALLSAKIGYELKIPMADSIVLATARKYNATIWTQDSDFKGLPGVKYIRRKSR